MSARSQALLWILAFLAGTQFNIYSAARWERLPAVLQVTSVVSTFLNTGTLHRCRKFRFTPLCGSVQSSCLHCKVRGLTSEMFKSLVLQLWAVLTSPAWATFSDQSFRKQIQFPQIIHSRDQHSQIKKYLSTFLTSFTSQQALSELYSDNLIN